MKVSAKLNNLRMPNRKIKLVTDLIIGMDVDEAMSQLESNVKKGSYFLIKLLNSAIANGENNFGIDRSNMYILDIIVKEGMTLKRWMPKAYGRATPIRKRMSKIEIVLEEREEGKNRKSKEQLESEKKERFEEKRKMEKEINDQQEVADKEELIEGGSREKKIQDKSGIKKDAATPNAGWANKIFRRKSGM